MRKEEKCLLGAVLLLFSTSICAQMAPGDEDNFCVSRLGGINKIPGVRMLLNSRHYEQLLGVGGAVWDQIDFDDNNPEGFVNPTYWQHSTGGRCQWSVKSCGSTAGSQENWLFTQFIKIMAPPNTTHNISVVIEVGYTLTNCYRRFGCTPAFEIYQFNTSGSQPRDVYTNTSNYHRIERKTGITTGQKIITIDVTVTPDIQGFYLAVRDRTSCIEINQLKVFRHECATKQEGLVVFSDNAAPVEDNMTVTTECMPNASPATDMSVTCDSSGYWTGLPECVCDPGYIMVTDSDGNNYCKACAEGFYRSGDDPPTECKPCPANTKMDIVAAPMCECLTGYFRNTEGLGDACPGQQSHEDVSTSCTKPPSMPLYLADTSNTSTSLSVEWSTPEYLGERDDLYYTVEYSDPDNVGVMLPMQCGGSCLTRTSCNVTGLRPATTYVVRVTAHNGVSDQDAGGALARQREITLMTAIAPPSVPLNVQPFCAVVVWEKPSSPNGKIMGYDIMFLFLRTASVTIRVEGDISHYVMAIPIPPGAMQIKVRAINEAGPGPYSDPTEMTCNLFNDPTPTEPVSSEPIPTSTICGTATVTEPPVTSTLTETVTTTTRIPVSTTAPSTTCLTPTPSPVPGALVEDIVVPSCGVVVWSPPSNSEGLVKRHAVRFFTGETMETTATSDRELQRHFDNPDTRFAVATNLPVDCSTVLYVQIRAGDDDEMWPWTEKVVIADADLCCGSEEPTTAATTTAQMPTPSTVTATVTTTATTTSITQLPPVTSTATVTTTATTTTTTQLPPVTSTVTTTTTTTEPCPTPTPTPPPECPEQDPCPSCSTDTATDPTLITLPGAPNVEEVMVMSCGAVGWMPPPETGGQIDHYVARFFTGDSMESTPFSERELQRFFDNPERHFAKADNLPSDCSTVLYAQIRAGNSLGMGPWSEKFVVADADLCCCSEEPSTAITPQPTCEPTTCPDPPACDSCCAECEECTCPPTVTCPPPTECPTCSSTNTPTTDDPCDTPGVPGNVQNVTALNCSVIVWDAPEDEHCCGHELTYKVRMYSGISFDTSSASQRKVFWTPNKWVTFSAEDIPTGRPLYTIVKARNSDGTHSADWTDPVLVTDSSTCPPADN